MGQPVKSTKLYKVYGGMIDAALEALKGEPLLDREGQPIIVDGVVLRKPCSAAHMREIRELLKDNGIDEEPSEGSQIAQVAKAIKHYDDEETQFLPEPEGRNERI